MSVCAQALQKSTAVYADCSNVITSTNELIASEGERERGKALTYDGVLRFGLEVAEEKQGNFVREVKRQKSHHDANEEGITEEGMKRSERRDKKEEITRKR